MPAAVSTQRIVVKARSGLDEAVFSLGGPPITFQAEPLFESIRCGGGAFGVVPGKTCYLLKLAIALDEANIWDLCHSVVRDGFGVAAGAPGFAEPDFPRLWILGNPVGLGMAVASMCGAPNVANFDTGYDPAHQALPRYLNKALQRNFVGALDCRERCRFSTMDHYFHTFHRYQHL